MQSKLPINLGDLLKSRTVENERIEYKSGWNPDPIIQKPSVPLPTILKTLVVGILSSDKIVIRKLVS